MPRVQSKRITIAEANGDNAEAYDLLVDENGRLQWFEQGDSEDSARAGQPVRHGKRYFGGGLGHTVEDGAGGYYISKNCYVGNPFAVRPRPTITTVTLTDNGSPVLQFFEAVSASGLKYLYALNETTAYKVCITGTPALKNTRDFSVPNIAFATGSYTSDGSYRGITTIFTPKAVIIKAIDGAYAGVIKTDQMGQYSYKHMDGAYTGDVSDQVQIVTGGFIIVGSATNFNHDGTTYMWMALGGKDAYVKTGKFSGDGADDRDITIDTGWGQPDALFIFTNDADNVCFRNKANTADETWDLGAIAAPTANIVEATADWPTDGFEVGSDNRANRSGTNNVFYLALKQDTDVLKIGSYPGDGNDDVDITDPSHDPTYALICSGEAAVQAPVHRSDKCSGDSSMFFYAVANSSDYIQDLITDGFQVGANDGVNKNTVTYYYLTLCPDPTGRILHGQPAKWNDIWEKPNGDIVDGQGLTTILDGTGDDTWTPRTDLKAQHLQIMGNKIAKAHDDNKISLCSEDDLGVAGNWGDDYPVGPAGTVITGLAELGGELLVGHRKGMAMFDGVALAREEMPLLGGVEDEENGKGMFIWLSQVLLPTADGLLRWLWGSVKAIGPDWLRDYVDAEGVSDEPRRLQHFGGAFLGDFIYSTCVDPNDNYHMGYAQPVGEVFRWDLLFTTTNECKVAKVDSERRLWFQWGNDIAFVQLDHAGRPSGGTYGEVSSSGSLILPEIVLAEGAEVSLRELRVATRNNATGLKWKAYVYRDGGSREQVGASAGWGGSGSDDGVKKLYWDPTADLKARRLRIEIEWNTDGTYTVETTPPEFFDVEVRGVAVVDDADAIRAIVGLYDENRTQEKVYADLKAHINAGVRQVRHPITNEVLDVIIYDKELAFVRQRDYQEPDHAIMLYMRRGDTS